MNIPKTLNNMKRNSHMKKEEQKKLYRYEIDYRSIDNETSVRLREYYVLRETEHTYFINPTVIGVPREAKKRVLKDAYDTYAYATKEQAKNHFIRRTRKRIEWYKFWIEECEKGLELIKTE